MHWPSLVPTQLIRLPDWLIDFLTELTGKNVSLYTSTDIIAFVVVVGVLTYAAVRNDKTGLKRAWKALYVIGIPLTAYTLIFRGTLNLALQMGFNLLLISIVGVVAYKQRFLSDEGMKLLVGVGIIIPTYPFLTVFPLQRSILPNPFNAFGFTLFTYLALLILLYMGINVVRNRDKDGSLLMRALGRRVPTEEAHEHDAVILEYANRFENTFTAAELRKYVEWTDKETLLDIEKIYAKQYAKAVSDSEDDISNEAITDFKAKIDYYRSQDELWILRSPGIARLLLVATLLALLFGDILFHAIL